MLTQGKTMSQIMLGGKFMAVSILDCFTEEELAGFTDVGEGEFRGPCIGGCINPATGLPYDCLIRTRTNDVWCFATSKKHDIITTLAIKQGRRSCGD